MNCHYRSKLYPLPQGNMHFCNAFDRLNNPCLTEVSSQRDVCSIHKDFYEPTKWFKRFILGTRGYSFSSGAKIQAVYKRGIVDGFVKITQSHFKDLEDCGKPLIDLVDYYLLCCNQSGVDPLWSNSLFMATVKCILDMHSSSIYELVSIHRSLLDRFVNPLFNCLRSFDSIMLYVLYGLIMSDKNNSSTANLNIDNPNASIIQYIKDHPKFKSEFLWMSSHYESKLLSLLNNSPAEETSLRGKIKTFVESFPALRVAQRESYSTSFLEKKNEIISLAWHPSRALDWCLDTDELKELKSRWNLSLVSQ